MSALPYVLVHTTHRSPLTRAVRKSTGGNRRGQIVLKNGVRLVKKGGRSTKLEFSTFVDNKDLLLEKVTQGRLEVMGPDLKVLSLDELKSLVGGKPAPKPAPKKSEPKPEPAPEPEVAAAPEPEPEPEPEKPKPSRKLKIPRKKKEE